MDIKNRGSGSHSSNNSQTNEENAGSSSERGQSRNSAASSAVRSPSGRDNIGQVSFEGLARRVEVNDEIESSLRHQRDTSHLFVDDLRPTVSLPSSRPLSVPVRGHSNRHVFSPPHTTSRSALAHNLSAGPTIAIPSRPRRPLLDVDFDRSQHVHFSPLQAGNRSANFRPRWPDYDLKDIRSVDAHFTKHQERGEIPEHVRSPSQLELFTISFWKRPITANEGAGPNFLEKMGHSRGRERLYRFEPRTGFLSAVSRSTEEGMPAVVIHTIFQAKFRKSRSAEENLLAARKYFDELT